MTSGPYAYSPEGAEAIDGNGDARIALRATLPHPTTSRSWMTSSTTSSSSTRRPRIGMWLFLATEVMFFGGLITAYAVYRATSPREIALASQHLNVGLGCLNTVVLLGSSLTMALAVRAAQLRQHRELVI